MRSPARRALIFALIALWAPGAPANPPRSSPERETAEALDSVGGQLPFIEALFRADRPQICPAEPAAALPPLPAAIPARSVRERSRAVVDRCLGRVPASPAGARVSYVIRETDHLCEERFGPDLYSGSDVGYDLERRADGFHVTLGVRLSISSKHSYSDRFIIEERMNECAETINRFWRESYGIHMNLWFTTLSDVNYNRGVEVRDDDFSDGGARHSNSGTIYYGGIKDGPTHECRANCEGACTSGSAFARAQCRMNCVSGCEPIRQRELCLLLLHETGHMLGFPDEYRSDDCPDRRTVRQYGTGTPPPWSAMDSQEKGWDLIDFYPEHIETLLRPLCR